MEKSFDVAMISLLILCMYREISAPEMTTQGGLMLNTECNESKRILINFSK
jgi:hypothetical protein